MPVGGFAQIVCALVHLFGFILFLRSARSENEALFPIWLLAALMNGVGMWHYIQANAVGYV